MKIAIHAPTSTKLYYGKEKKALGGADRTLLEMCNILKKKHEVILYTNTNKHHKESNLEIKSLFDVHQDGTKYDIFIQYRVVTPINIKAKKKYFYTQDLANTPCFKQVSPDYFEQFDKIICLSEFHKKNFIGAYKVDDKKVKVLGNFCYDQPEQIDPKDPNLHIYCSTPFRGLALLPKIWLKIVEKNPEAKLEVYSSMSIYGAKLHDKLYFSSLYETLKKLPNVKYSAAISHNKLQKRMAEATYLLYPNTYPETYCNVINEAKSNGLVFVTSDLGALKETGGDAGIYVEPSRTGYVERFVTAYNFLKSDYEDYHHYCENYRGKKIYTYQLKKILKIRKYDLQQRIEE